MGMGGLITPRPIGCILLCITSTDRIPQSHPDGRDPYCMHAEARQTCCSMVSSLGNPEPSHGSAKQLRLTALVCRSTTSFYILHSTE